MEVAGPIGRRSCISLRREETYGHHQNHAVGKRGPPTLQASGRPPGPPRSSRSPPHGECYKVRSGPHHSFLPPLPLLHHATRDPHTSQGRRRQWRFAVRFAVPPTPGDAARVIPRRTVPWSASRPIGGSTVSCAVLSRTCQRGVLRVAPRTGIDWEFSFP